MENELQAIHDLSILNRIFDCIIIFQTILEPLSSFDSLVILAYFVTLDCR